MHLRKLHNKSHYVHKYKISLTIFHTSIETGDPKDILSRDDHVYRNEWMQKQQRMFQTEPIFVSNIKLFQIHMQSTFNIWECIYELIAVIYPFL